MIPSVDLRPQVPSSTTPRPVYKPSTTPSVHDEMERVSPAAFRSSKQEAPQAPASRASRLPSFWSVMIGFSGVMLSAFAGTQLTWRASECAAERRIARKLEGKTFRPCGGPIICDEVWAREYPIAESYLNGSQTFRDLVHEIDAGGGRVYLADSKDEAPFMRGFAQRAVVMGNPRAVLEFDTRHAEKEHCRTYPPSMVIVHEFFHVRSAMRSRLATAFLLSALDPISTDLEELETNRLSNTVATELGLAARHSHEGRFRRGSHVNDDNRGECKTASSLAGMYSPKVRHAEMMHDLTLAQAQRDLFRAAQLLAYPFLKPKLATKARALLSEHERLLGTYIAAVGADGDTSRADARWQRHTARMFAAAEELRQANIMPKACPISQLPDVVTPSSSPR